MAADFGVQEQCHDIAGVIAETVERWDGEETSQKIEIQVDGALWSRSKIAALANPINQSLGQLLAGTLKAPKSSAPLRPTSSWARSP